MDVSIILCTYNRCESLKTVLESISKLQVDRETNWELLVVDNNSTDYTKQLCEEFIGKYPETFRYLFEERQGKTFALNTGIRASRGDIIAFTDDDVTIDERWLSSIKRAFIANPGCKAFGGRVIPVWPEAMPPWIAKEGAFRNTDGVIVEHDLGDIEKSYYQAGTYPPIGANMFFSSDIFEKYGGFNEKLNLGVKNIPMLEDTEFCGRLLKGKEKIIYIPDSIVYHPVCQDRLTKSYFRKHTFKSGRALYIINEVQRSGRYVVFDLRKNRRILFNIPLYIFRGAFSYLLHYVAAVWKRKPQEIIFFEKSLILYSGMIYEIFKEKLRQ